MWRLQGINGSAYASDNYQEIEILLDFETEKVITLGELTPEW